LSFLRLRSGRLSGSTVEARGGVIVGKSVSWRVGRIKDPRLKVDKKRKVQPSAR
jgi:hypothetical protein